MTIGLIDVDGHNFPNLALMKISRYWKQNGANVEWYSPWQHYDKVYMSKVFTFTPDFQQRISNADTIEKGGTGYKDYDKVLPPEIDGLQPDYSIYPNLVDNKTAYGFLTRGCIRKCKFCIVPKKEGLIHPYMDIEQIAVEHRTNIVLMDNNILASDFGLGQIEKIVKLNLKVDFNQSLDARLVTDDIAQLLAKVKWLKYLRFACDSPAQIPHVLKASELCRKYGYKNGGGKSLSTCYLTEILTNAMTASMFSVTLKTGVSRHSHSRFWISRANANRPNGRKIWRDGATENSFSVQAISRITARGKDLNVANILNRFIS